VYPEILRPIKAFEAFLDAELRTCAQKRYSAQAQKRHDLKDAH